MKKLEQEEKRIMMKINKLLIEGNKLLLETKKYNDLSMMICLCIVIFLIYVVVCGIYKK